VLNIIYRVMLGVITLVLIWNVLMLKDQRKQLMSAIVIIPFVLRIIGIK
jgi:hypothetical protein